MSGFLQIQTTTADGQHAEAIAQTLLKSRLAACVQVIGPIKSFYRWQGTIETSHEWLCLIKTSVAKFAEVEAAIRELHTYDVPEIVALPIADGSKDYLGWLGDQL
jgi:periplasmic divalent cation tolerance protein